MSTTKPKLYSSRTADKFVLRLPDGMRERVAKIAADAHRSMNAEMVTRLEASINSDLPLAAMPAIPVEPWNPVIGMAVTLREGDYAGLPLVIKDLLVAQEGLMARVTAVRGDGLNLITDLRPFIAK